MELEGKAERAGKLLKERAQGLVAYLKRLRSMLEADKRTRFLGEEEVALCAWAWRHREVLGLEDAAEAWPTRAEAARAVWSALDEGSVRSTGMVENLGAACWRRTGRVTEACPSRCLRCFGCTATTASSRAVSVPDIARWILPGCPRRTGWKCSATAANLPRGRTMC